MATNRFFPVFAKYHDENATPLDWVDVDEAKWMQASGGADFFRKRGVGPALRLTDHNLYNRRSNGERTRYSSKVRKESRENGPTVGPVHGKYQDPLSAIIRQQTKRSQ